VARATETTDSSPQNAEAHQVVKNLLRVFIRGNAFVPVAGYGVAESVER